MDHTTDFIFLSIVIITLVISCFICFTRVFNEERNLEPEPDDRNNDISLTDYAGFTIPRNQL